MIRLTIEWMIAIVSLLSGLIVRRESVYYKTFICEKLTDDNKTSVLIIMNKKRIYLGTDYAD